jgi:NTE family protein
VVDGISAEASMLASVVITGHAMPACRASRPYRSAAVLSTYRGARFAIVRTQDALVLGGGGVAGIAWITGLLAGLADAGQDVTGADLIIGTSAGATVAAQLGSGLSVAELHARQVEPALQSRELTAALDWAKFAADIKPYLVPGGTASEQLRGYGRFALAADTVPESARIAVNESRLPSRQWPASPTKLTAVDCESGELAVFDAASGVGLVQAVAASSAVPGVWPPVTIGGRRYMDGGVRSPDNADLAAGAARVTVISPLGLDSPLATTMPLREVLAGLKAGGAAVTVISPDEASAAAIGTNALDPATRVPAATAGRAQGRAGLPPAF